MRDTERKRERERERKRERGEREERETIFCILPTFTLPPPCESAHSPKGQGSSAPVARAIRDPVRYTTATYNLIDAPIRAEYPGKRNENEMYA